MIKHAALAGVSQVKRWGHSQTVVDVFKKLGLNSGNMVFTEALSRVLQHPKLSTFSVSDQEIEGCDGIVLAAANWISEFDDFGWLADAVERTKLPVFLIGVGAQATLDHAIPKIKPGTLKLLKIVSERSALLAARGDFTCEVLEHYGIKNAVPTGCPSLLLAGASGPVFEQKPSTDGVIVHATRHGFHRCDEFQSWIYREALRHDRELLLQSEVADVYYTLGKTNNTQILEQAEPVLSKVYDTDMTVVADYLKRRGLFFTDFETWISYLKKRTFCTGTRIHATIASIIAGTPATLIAHDSRTLELARTMGIPHVLSSELQGMTDLPMERLMEAHLAASSYPNYRNYFDRYIDVFKKNGLMLSSYVGGSDKANSSGSEDRSPAVQSQ